MTHRFSGHEPGQGSDTAGVPWRGRTLTGTGFDGDTGQADGALAALLADPDPDPSAVVAALATARLLVPIVAVAAEVDDSSGIPVDARSDMASVTLVAPDGQRALPVFTSTAALAAWDPDARPVPVTAQRAARAALQEGCGSMPLDLPAPPGSPVWTVRPSMVRALALGRSWLPAHEDAQVARAVAAAVQDEPAVARTVLAGADGGALLVRLAVLPGLTGSELQALLARVGGRVAADEDARGRIDALTFAVRPA